MTKLDAHAESTLKRIVIQGKNELPICSPDYDKSIVDYLIEQGFLTKLDASTLSGWLYLISPTHKATIYFDPNTVFDNNSNTTYNINPHVEINAKKVINKKSFNEKVEDSINVSVDRKGGKKKSIFSRLFDLFKKK